MSEFPAGLFKHKQIQHDLAAFISLKEYCKRFHCTRSGAMYRIERSRIIAYKISGRWWILPPD